MRIPGPSDQAHQVDRLRPSIPGDDPALAPGLGQRYWAAGPVDGPVWVCPDRPAGLLARRGPPRPGESQLPCVAVSALAQCGCSAGAAGFQPVEACQVTRPCRLCAGCGKVRPRISCVVLCCAVLRCVAVWCGVAWCGVVWRDAACCPGGAGRRALSTAVSAGRRLRSSTMCPTQRCRTRSWPSPPTSPRATPRNYSITHHRR